MLFEKVVTHVPLILYSDITQIAAIGGVLIFFGIIAMVVDEFNPLYLLSLMYFVGFVVIHQQKNMLNINKLHYLLLVIKLK